MSVISIEKLENGTIFYKNQDGTIGHLYPPFKYDNNIPSIIDNSSVILNLNLSLKKINNVDFNGNLEQLKVAVSDFVVDCNQEFINFYSFDSGQITQNQDDQTGILNDIKTSLELIAKITDTQPISAASLPLPSGASTLGKQDDQIIELQAANDKLTNILNKSFDNSTSVLKTQQATLARMFDFETAISLGLFDGMSIVNKAGRNPSISSATVPEDVWNGGGIYTGFPTGAPEEITVESDNAGDTGQLTFSYLASSTSTAWQTATVTLNGTTPVNTGITAYRVHTAQYASGSPTAFNLGIITIRHRTTVANVFAKMQPGRSQTNVAGYTIPFGYNGYIRNLTVSVLGGTNGNIEGALWVRGFGGSPRLRRLLPATNTNIFKESPYGGLAVSQQTDIMVRVVSSANGLDVSASYDILLVKN